ncbi:MAG: hypothetical protein BGO01_07835 [Armatimonadetes bacterium 55-13]|nr:DUF1801 domain-containing protein [Armatimonadota bacterium]OJU63776.1 MAG: hypothetical protein BGO01_07835 [Armatimonadetes bacterium 55-13]
MEIGKDEPGDFGGSPQIAGIESRSDWRGKVLGRVRALIREADPEVVEEVKWVKPSNPHGVPVWSQGGILCTGEVYKDKVKFTFAQGASLPDPEKVFNASLDAGTRRALDIFENDDLNEDAFKALIQAAVALNASKKKR